MSIPFDDAGKTARFTEGDFDVAVEARPSQFTVSMRKKGAQPWAVYGPASGITDAEKLANDAYEALKKLAK